MILTSVYDAASNRTRLSASVGGTADFENDYTFDALNRMTRVEQIGQGGGNTVASKGANFAYNALSQFTSVERQVKPSSTWNEVATTLRSRKGVGNRFGFAKASCGVPRRQRSKLLSRISHDQRNQPRISRNSRMRREFRKNKL